MAFFVNIQFILYPAICNIIIFYGSITALLFLNTLFVLLASRISVHEEPLETPPDTIKAIACELSMLKGLTASFGKSKTLPAKLYD
jgi:hypothetical protein